MDSLFCGMMHVFLAVHSNTLHCLYLEVFQAAQAFEAVRIEPCSDSRDVKLV